MIETINRKKVPAEKVPLLNFTVGDAFCRDRYLTSVIVKLHQNGIVRLGHLIQISEDDLFRIVKTTSDNRDRVKNCLREFGLELDMDVAEGSFDVSTNFMPPPRPH